MSILNLLQSKTLAEFESRKPAAQAQLETIFPAASWGIDFECSEYAADNFNNLWNNELRKPIRHRLKAKGWRRLITQAGSGKSTSSTSVFIAEACFLLIRATSDGALRSWQCPQPTSSSRGSRHTTRAGSGTGSWGWRLNLLFDAARDGLGGTGTGVSLPGRKVQADDWDREGLIKTSVQKVAGVDLATVPGVDHLILKDVRTTTAKKIIASYITIEPHAAGVAEPALLDSLRVLEKAASALASGAYPFRSTDEFEPVRSLALQDLAAASLRLQLRRKSSTRSAVRIYYGPPGTGKTLSAVRKP